VLGRAEEDKQRARSINAMENPLDLLHHMALIARTSWLHRRDARIHGVDGWRGDGKNATFSSFGTAVP
jgi:hypothetical protein